MFYSSVLKNNAVIAEYSYEQGDFQATQESILNTYKQSVDFYAIPLHEYELYFLHNGEYIFTLITQKNLDSEKILSYLDDLKVAILNEEDRDEEAGCLNLNMIIKDEMVYNIFFIITG
jgi:hypothetical protein